MGRGAGRGSKEREKKKKEKERDRKCVVYRGIVSRARERERVRE